MKTADKWLAGTGSTIKIEIFGTDGHMSMQRLGGSFSQDATATTTFYENFGEPYRIRVDHDGSGTASGWKLSKVTLCCPKLYYTALNINRVLMLPFHLLAIDILKLNLRII